MTDEYLKKLLRRMVVATAIVAPIGVIVAAAVGGKGVLAGALVGFALAILNGAAVLAVLAWALKQKVQWLPSLLMGSYLVRLIILVAALYGLTRVNALSPLAMLIAFLVLFLTLTGAEVYTAWQSFGTTFGEKRPGGGSPDDL